MIISLGARQHRQFFSLTRNLHLQVMAKSSALCSSAFPSFPTFSRSKRSSLSTKRATFPSSFTTKPPSSLLRCGASNSKGGGGYLFGDDSFGFYPWESDSASSADGDGSIQWVQEDTVTLFTTDGLIRIGGSMVPRQISSSEQLRSKNFKRFQRQESDYMDPNQELCLGALFDIAATNGLDLGRRLCIFGFCRSIEMLSDIVEDTVLEFGGEVLAAEKASTGGFHERLTMSVAVPLLWGVPPASDTLHLAVRSGGGIVDKIYWQWDSL